MAETAYDYIYAPLLAFNVQTDQLISDYLGSWARAGVGWPSPPGVGTTRPRQSGRSPWK